MANVEKYEMEIKKVEAKLSKLKKAKVMEENKQLVRIGKLYCEAKNKNGDLTYDEIYELLQNEIQETQINESEISVKEELEEIEMKN
ncbi:hypothetical protein [Enterococcus diestrammenae]|uniref:Conjugal transfer protein n=1 Tax=Enterococcus diestrammenae TaxID=1155073 RepID=A0ABV0F1U9_9ENTE|nr:hypothetical protein [Enterococcus diestrammenae]KAF1300069.1 hypothetical protein BAU18_08400 [Enterococcus diestrammenae]